MAELRRDCECATAISFPQRTGVGASNERFATDSRRKNVRMSTDQQDYSISHQQHAIANYASVHRFKVIKTYADEGKSGLTFRERLGLQTLVRDVTSGDPGFNVILVYDVSRWGRFQDIDEAAHYEFLCRSAGIAVHYCVECFENDGKPANAFLKTMKRSMAAEFSNALSKRVVPLRDGWCNSGSRWEQRRCTVSDECLSLGMANSGKFS
jgi:hypothetical protein